MGTGLKRESLPLIRINFPVNKSIEASLKSITALFEFYGILPSEAEEIKGKILKLIRDFDLTGKAGRIDIDVVPRKEMVEIELSIKEEWIKKNISFSFKSKKIRIFKIWRKGERIRIKIGVSKGNSLKFK